VDDANDCENAGKEKVNHESKSSAYSMSLCDVCENLTDLKILVSLYLPINSVGMIFTPVQTGAVAEKLHEDSEPDDRNLSLKL
jgi:hypothetical protein